MNGDSDHASSPAPSAVPVMGSGSYSFFLNVIVLDVIAPLPSASPDIEASTKAATPVATSTTGEGAATEATPLPTTTTTTTSLDDGPENNNDNNDDDPPPPTPVRSGSQTEWLALDAELLDKKKTDILKKSLQGLDKSMRGFTKRSTAVANKAGAFVSNTTKEAAGALTKIKSTSATNSLNKKMVPRALAALHKSLPELMSSSSSSSSLQDLDVTIGKRFHQGKVIVLHVSLKASGMARYVLEIKGQEAADHYRDAMKTLEALGATQTMACLQEEMLPHVRTGLMERLSNLLVQTMKEKDSESNSGSNSGSLEIECIALEEAEEARWLFNFMEFQAQMA